MLISMPQFTSRIFGVVQAIFHLHWLVCIIKIEDDRALDHRFFGSGSKAILVAIFGRFAGKVHVESVCRVTRDQKEARSFGMGADMRVFVAIDLPDHVSAELEALQSSLATGRPVPAGNLHLTLSFLGEQPEESIEEAHHALSTIRAPAFDVQFAGVDSFGTRAPQVIVAEVARCHELHELERQVTRALRTAGLQFQKRRFRPHVTIARLPRALSTFELCRVRDYLEEHAAFRGSSFEVRRFQLCRSILRPKAALHEALASYELMDI